MWSQQFAADCRAQTHDAILESSAWQELAAVAAKAFLEGKFCLDVLTQGIALTSQGHSGSEQIRGSHFLSCYGLLNCSHAKCITIQSSIQIKIKTYDQKSVDRPTFFDILSTWSKYPIDRPPRTPHFCKSRCALDAPRRLGSAQLKPRLKHNVKL